MLKITPSIVSGSGTLPKDISLGTSIVLTLNESAITYFWELLSYPKESSVVLKSPAADHTIVGPLDTYGVYAVRVWLDKGLSTQKSKIISLHVPKTSTGVVALQPTENITGRVRNGDFELPGLSPGTAAFWNVTDDANILSSRAGTYRGRIKPSGFSPASGEYAMCLGDDNNNLEFFDVGKEFKISQQVDFTGVNVLKFKMKFRKT